MNQVATCLIVMGFGISFVIGFFADLVRRESVKYLGEEYTSLYDFQKRSFHLKYMQNIKIPKRLRNDYFGCILISYFGFLLIFIGFLLIGRFLWALALLAFALLIALYTRDALKSAFLGDETD